MKKYKIRIFKTKNSMIISKERNIYCNTNYTTERIMQFESQTNPSDYSNTTINKFTVIPKYLDKWTNQEVTDFSVSWLQPKFEAIQVTFGQLQNIEESFLAEEILNYMSDEFKNRVFENKYLKKVFVSAIIEIKKYLEQKGMRYDIHADVWHDIENFNWQENVITIKIRYKDRTEKNKIWEEISSIVKKYETDDIVILTEIKSL